MTKTSDQKIQEWLEGNFDQKTKKEIEVLQKENPILLEEAFSKDLEFGTGGMRGIMSCGPNRINQYTISKATIAVANYFQSLYKDQSLKAVISYDNRHHSKEYANLVAEILATKGIVSYLTPHLRPTPFVSFLVRYHQADFGIMITASHNPKEYNGYKVYGKDGGQIVSPHDHAIEKILRSIDFKELPKNLQPNSPLIHLTGEKEDTAYLLELSKITTHIKQSLDFGHFISILYTNLHGTGLTLVPYALKQIGFKNLHLVQEQSSFDGNFSNAPSPNPEDKKALELGIKILEEKKYDLFLATDPDADRLAATVYHEGKPYTFSGNEMAILCLEYLLQAKESKGELSKDLLVISTIVSSRLLKKICEGYFIGYLDVLTGFKYIGEQIQKLAHCNQEHHFLFGAEESYGFLYGTYTRDKDAIAASCLLAEMTLHYKLKEQTLVDALHEIYRSYGLIREKTATISLKEGLEGSMMKDKIMHQLKDPSLEQIDEIPIIAICDYEEGFRLDKITGKKESIRLPSSSVISLELEDESEIIIRPSGTEPKIKIYVNYQIKSFLSTKDAINECEKKLNERVHHVKNTLLSFV